jgi:hypothetical protein
VRASVDEVRREVDALCVERNQARRANLQRLDLIKDGSWARNKTLQYRMQFEGPPLRAQVRSRRKALSANARLVPVHDEPAPGTAERRAQSPPRPPRGWSGVFGGSAGGQGTGADGRPVFRDYAPPANSRGSQMSHAASAPVLRGPAQKQQKRQPRNHPGSGPLGTPPPRGWTPLEGGAAVWGERQAVVPPPAARPGSEQGARAPEDP